VSCGLLLLLAAHDDFALTHHLLIQPELVFEVCSFDPWLHGSAQESHSSGRLEDVRTERATVHIEFDFQVTRVRNPRHLVAWIEYHGLRDKSYQYWAFRHFSSLKLFADKTIAHLLVAPPLRTHELVLAFGPNAGVTAPVP
jgi:hypothetical protein